MKSTLLSKWNPRKREAKYTNYYHIVILAKKSKMLRQVVRVRLLVQSGQEVTIRNENPVITNGQGAHARRDHKPGHLHYISSTNGSTSRTGRSSERG